MKKLIIVVLCVFFSISFVFGVVLPSTFDSEQIVNSIKIAVDESGKYCYNQSVTRDKEIKTYIDENIIILKDHVDLELTKFKFAYSIVTFIVVFLAFYLNEFLKFRRDRKLEEINKTVLPLNPINQQKRPPIKPELPTKNTIQKTKKKKTKKNVNRKQK